MVAYENISHIFTDHTISIYREQSIQEIVILSIESPIRRESGDIRHSMWNEVNRIMHANQ